MPTALGRAQVLPDEVGMVDGFTRQAAALTGASFLVALGLLGLSYAGLLRQSALWEEQHQRIGIQDDQDGTYHSP